MCTEGSNISPSVQCVGSGFCYFNDRLVLLVIQSVDSEVVTIGFSFSCYAGVVQYFQFRVIRKKNYVVVPISEGPSRVLNVKVHNELVLKVWFD